MTDRTPGTEILRCEVGSTLHGIGIGSDDLDLMGVMVEPREAVTGLQRLEHHTWRSAPKGQRSEPGDTDLVVYGLRKYLHLATQGNPSVILLLFAPEGFLHHVADLGHELRGMRPAIVSQRCRDRFLGYLHGQRERAVNRGGFRRGAREGRSEKWAAHMVRLGYEAVELLSTGHLTLPMPTEQAEFCKAVKRGEVSLDEAVAVAADLERAARNVSSPLPEHPDVETIEAWMHHAYLTTWEGTAP